MASFSFGAGNVGKLLRIPLYLAGRLVTAVVPRSEREWVFGCAVGIADGALALWERAAQADARAVWLTGSPREAAEAARRGIPSVPKHSVRGFWRTARARVVVVTHGFGDVNRYATAGAVVVQLWHGIPLKRIGLDSPETTRTPVRLLRPLVTALYRRTQRRIAVLPAASHLVRGRLESAFGLPDERVVVTGEPRVDVLSAGTPEERRTTARARLDELVPGLAPRLVLYAPTWRDGDADPAVPSAAQWERIIETLDACDATLLIRSHPLGAGDYRPPRETGRVRELGSDLVAVATGLLPGVDVFVTDYSSLVYDSALVPLPVVFLAPDEEAYGARRGFYGTYREVAGDAVAVTWEDAIAQTARILTDPAERERRLERARALDARVHAFADGRNTARVYDAVDAALRGRRSTS